MNQTFEHKPAGWKIEIKTLTQGDVDDYYAAYKQLAPAKETIAEQPATVVRAAITAGWIVEPAMTVDQVRSLVPGYVRWMAGKIDRVYKEATSIPPE